MDRTPGWSDREGLREDDGPRSVVELHVPVSTILKVLVTALIVWAVLKLIPEFLFFLLSLLLAIGIAPLVSRLETRGVKRGMAVAIVAVLTVVTVVGFVVLVGPPLVAQLTTLVEHFPEYQRRVQGRIAPEHPVIKKVVEQIFAIPSSPEIAASLRKPLAWGEAAIAGVMIAVLVLTLTLYLVADGKRTYAWLLAYVPRRHRKKIAQTIPEVSDVVIAYVQGQALTSFLFGAFSLVVLLIFKVPAAMPLAVLAAFCDVLPVIGLIAATVPAVLLALTVSPVAAASVLALYLLYHLLENTVIIPRVYGRRLSLSTLAVMIALVIGGRLYGVLGAVLILPFVAAYPIVERIWLHEYLSDEVVHDHKALEAAAESGSDRAVEKVLKGEVHRSEGT
ncbi:MAG: AI-2E family transporter [Acidobacteriota bacterium]|nr:AI-2E family transporter [Acidobacteriota bacterium]